MRDLEIWRRLNAGTASVDDIRELGELNHGRLGPYIDAVLPLVSHEDRRMRIAALAVVAGSRGIPGVRAIALRLDDDDAEVRAAAVAALHDVAKQAPARFVHALYHPREDVRRAALGCELSTQVAELAVYLRSDRATSDAAAAKGRWPDGSLGLALDMYRSGHVPAREVVDMFVHESAVAVAALLSGAHARAPEVVDDYLTKASRERVGLPAGRDVLDTLFHAIAAVGVPWRAVDHLVSSMNPRKQRALVRRAVVSLLSHLQGTPHPALWALCVALDPRVIGFPLFDASLAPAAVAGLFRLQWPVRPGTVHAERLLELPLVKADLALAAAVVGLLPAKRLATLAGVLGEAEILARLRASDHGWDEICQLPQEIPPLSLVWLSRIAIGEHSRYVALAGRAIATFANKRLETFIDQLPRRHRAAVFAAALAAVAHATSDRIGHVCHAIAARADRAALIEILKSLIPSDADGRRVLALLRATGPALLASALREIDEPSALRVVALVDTEPLPRDRELAIAHAFADRLHPAIEAWRARVKAFGEEAAPTVVVAPRVRRELASAERKKIETCSHRDLGDALKPAFDGLVSGLCSALAARAAAAPSLAVCNALLGCSDPLPDVARQLDRFFAPTEKFAAELDNAAVTWVRTRELPPLAHARLWRWDAHGFALATWIEQTGGVLTALLYIDKLPGAAARATLWKGISEVVMLLRFRQLERMRTLTKDVGLYCASRIDTDIGSHAARIVAALVESRSIPLATVRETLFDHIADAGPTAREYVGRMVRLDGVPDASSPETSAQPLVDEIRACTDLDALAAWCRDPRPPIVQEAALTLCTHGAAGQLRLAALLVERDRLPSPIPILQTISLWDHEPAIEAIRALAREPDLPPAWQFHVALALHARGDARAIDRAFSAVRAPGGGWYFRREDYAALEAASDPVRCALALVESPHHHAYQRALGVLLSLTRPTEDVHAALARFLEIGNDRPIHLRVAVARNLAAAWADPLGLPILAEYIADERADDWPYTLELVPKPSKPAIAKLIVSAALIGGQGMCSEKRMWLIVQRLRRDLDPETLRELDVRIFEEAATGEARRAASQYVMTEGLADTRLARVAEVFAWGVKRGVELTGGLYRIHMTAKERDFGHTRLDGNRIFVSALPMLRSETHGQDVVEGLILHELGHHVYHRGDEALKLWKKAHAEGIGHFLNLVADEHLERNLRALDPTYGDRLKRLGAYAFHHAPQEIKLEVLCSALGAATAHALIHAELEVAYDEEAVRLRRGAILAELDRAGHAVARFARALRMGLGNRSGDPLVAQALGLCGKELRSLDMRGLYELTRRLVHLFGGEVEICKVFGGPEGLVFGERDDDVFGAGIDDDVLQREVERILDPRRSKSGAAAGPIDRLQINVNPDTEFDRITHIQRVRADAELHRKLAVDVQRHSARLRAYLDDLGLRWLPMRARTSGRALDRTRLRALVTRNDPRILIARTPTRKTDLFLGTIVDCSSSMTAGQNIERAKRFAVLVAEAVRPLPGVEARFFGFTDSVIYDAGNARDCNVVALQASGGNNDAAALYHAANVAVAAPQRAKVLVMISDGLPTECSVAALRSLVTQLTRRRGIVCAQVAVRRLEEVAFPNYVVLDDREPDVAVARFGRMIADLARRSLSA